MIRALVVLAVFVALTLACAPSTPENTTSGAASNGNAGNTVVKRSTQLVTVTMVSNINYNPSQNPLNMEIVQAIITDFAKSQDIKFNTKNISRQPKNQGGKFAVVYTIQGVECERIQQFATGAKRASANVAYILVKCESRPQLVIS